MQARTTASWRHTGQATIRTSLATFIALATAACGTLPPPPSAEFRDRLGRIGIISTADLPSGEFQTYARSREAGAAKGLTGALLTDRAGAGTLIDCAAIGGPICPLLALPMLGFAAVVGASEAVPESVTQEIERRIEAVVNEATLNSALADAISLAAADRPELSEYALSRFSTAIDVAGEGIGTLLEVNVRKAGFQGGKGTQPALNFFILAQVRLVDLRSGAELLSRDFRYRSERRPFSEWSAADGERLGEMLGRAHTHLAARILDELFLVAPTRFSFAAQAASQAEVEPCGLRPRLPLPLRQGFWKLVAAVPGEDFARSYLLYVPVDSLQPKLAWAPLPTSQPEIDAKRIPDVRYDLKVWEDVGGAPGPLVYEASGLGEPTHRLLQPLNPGSRYLWSVRARLRLDGRLPTTRWAFSAEPGASGQNACDAEEIPNDNYYRFMTP